MCYGLEGFEGFATSAMARKLWPARSIEAFGVRFPKEPQGAGDSEAGVPDPLAPPARTPTRPTVRLERLKHGLDLHATMVYPDGRGLLVEHALLDQDHCLIGETGCQGADFQRTAARRTRTGDQRPLRPGQFVKIIQNRGTLDERLAVIRHQHWYTQQWIEGCDPGCIPERRPWAVLIRKAIEDQSDRDTPDERRIILAD